MQDIFEPMVNESLLIWIDDAMIFAKDVEGFMRRLEHFLELVHAHRLKLSATKSVLFSQSVVWCGQVIDGDSMRHDPAKIDALVSLCVATNAMELQYFLYAAGWKRIIDFTRVFDPLRRKLDDALAGCGRKARTAEKIKLGCSDTEL
jgi:hypothetical protein